GGMFVCNGRRVRHQRRPRNLLMAHPDLSAEQRRWFESAVALIDIGRLYRLNREITAIHSPTGRERTASEHMVRYLTKVEAIADWDQTKRVAIIATGGLSHSVGSVQQGFVDVDFDRRFLSPISAP